MGCRGGLLGRWQSIYVSAGEGTRKSHTSVRDVVYPAVEEKLGALARRSILDYALQREGGKREALLTGSPPGVPDMCMTCRIQWPRREGGDVYRPDLVIKCRRTDCF